MSGKKTIEAPFQVCQPEVFEAIVNGEPFDLNGVCHRWCAFKTEAAVVLVEGLENLPEWTDFNFTAYIFSADHRSFSRKLRRDIEKLEERLYAESNFPEENRCPWGIVPLPAASVWQIAAEWPQLFLRLRSIRMKLGQRRRLTGKMRNTNKVKEDFSEVNRLIPERTEDMEREEAELEEQAYLAQAMCDIQEAEATKAAEPSKDCTPEQSTEPNLKNTTPLQAQKQTLQRLTPKLEDKQMSTQGDFPPVVRPKTIHKAPQAIPRVIRHLAKPIAQDIVPQFIQEEPGPALPRDVSPLPIPREIRTALQATSQPIQASQQCAVKGLSTGKYVPPHKAAVNEDISLLQVSAMLPQEDPPQSLRITRTINEAYKSTPEGKNAEVGLVASTPNSPFFESPQLYPSEVSQVIASPSLAMVGPSMVAPGIMQSIPIAPLGRPVIPISTSKLAMRLTEPAIEESEDAFASAPETVSSNTSHMLSVSHVSTISHVSTTSHVSNISHVSGSSHFSGSSSDYSGDSAQVGSTAADSIGLTVPSVTQSMIALQATQSHQKQLMNQCMLTPDEDEAVKRFLYLLFRTELFARK